VTGTGDAWSHPHSSNLLGAGGFMMDGTYTNDGWADEGTPTAVAALATAEMIFYGGYKVTSDAANEGIYKDYTCSAGDNFVIRAIGHSDGTSVPKAILYDQDNTTEIGSLTGSTASTRTAPDIFIFTGQAPAGCTTLRVKLVNTDATADDITYWHQCELLNNLLSNPSFETGAGNPWVPTGWTNVNVDADESEAEAGTVHSGSGSIQFNTGASWEYMYDSNPLTSGKFFCMGGWTYGDGANGYFRIMPNMGADALIQYSPTAFFITTPTTASWSLTQGVWRNVGGGGQAHLMLSSGATGERFADDYFVIAMDDVSLNIYPASEANCTETQGIRVVGRTVCTTPLARLTTKKGVVRITVTPRHGAGIFTRFKGVSTYPAMLKIFYDTENYILFRVRGNDNNLGMTSRVNNETIESNVWTATGLFEADTTYLIEIEWDLPSLIKCSIDGTQRLATTTHTEIFAQAPDVLYVGLDQYQSARQFDAVYGSPT